MAYELPENLGSLTPEELDTLLNEGLDAFRGLNLAVGSSEDDVAEGERIAPLIQSIVAEQRAQEARGARAEAAATLIEEATAPVAEETPEDPPEDPPAEPPAEPATEEAAITPDEVLTPVAASTSPARRAAANAAPPQIPARRTEVAALVAAADVPGIPTGAPLDGLGAAAEAVIRRMKGMPTVSAGGQPVQHRYGAAMIRKEGWGELTQAAKVYDDHDLIWQAGRESRLPGGSLVASGGWCVPSETLYDLCAFESFEGMLSMPEIGITRGGIRWTTGPDFSDIYEACGFFITNEQAEAGGPFTKTCCIVECPEFEEIRLEAIGLCVKAPLLTQAAWPELVRRFMEGALVAHQHKVNKYLIDQISAAAGTGPTVADTGSLSLSLEALNFIAIGMRYRHRLGDSTTIEIVAPQWLKALWIADLGMRQFSPSSAQAHIAQWLADRNLSVQWVFDFQDLVVDGCAVDYPANVRLLMYPAGSWIKGSLDVINIDAVYDSTGLAENVYTALFIEEGILAVQRCLHTCAVNIPICVSGRVAANDISACLTVAGGVGVIPTGATAGTPGTWTPANAEPVDSLAEARSRPITASPATAWTAGQYVRLSDGKTKIHWDSNSWESGPA